MVVRSQELSKLAAALGGIPILGCRRDSPAGRAGLTYGDVLLSVNGMQTPDWAAYIEARALSARSMTVEVFREGLHLHFELELDLVAIGPQELLAEIIADSLVPLAPPPPSAARDLPKN